MKWKLIIDKNPRTAAENMSIDSAIQQLCKVPTLRLYTWNPPAVSIGRFQSLRDEVDLDFCKKNNIDFIRRVTGGGAVFHDDEVTYSLCIPEENEFFSPDLHESYKEICNAVMLGISMFGLKPKYSPINDITVNNRKISGCAQTRKNKIILHHGTLLVTVDVEKMFSILKVPNEKIKDKMISDVKSRVTSICDELNRKVTREEVTRNIVKGFKEHFKIDFEETSISTKEEQLAGKIKKGVFENESWLHER